MHEGNSKTRAIKRRVELIASALDPSPELEEAEDDALPLELNASRIRSPAGRTDQGAELVEGTARRARRIPRALRICPHCGHELTHRQLKLALIDRLDQVAASASKAALELVRLAFPEDTPTPADAAAAQLEERRQRELYPDPPAKPAAAL